jgi:hypothetical protein
VVPVVLAEYLYLMSMRMKALRYQGFRASVVLARHCPQMPMAYAQQGWEHPSDYQLMQETRIPLLCLTQ